MAMPTISAFPPPTESFLENPQKAIKWMVLSLVIIGAFVIVVYAARQYIRNKYEDPRLMR